MVLDLSFRTGGVVAYADKQGIFDFDYIKNLINISPKFIILCGGVALELRSAVKTWVL